MTFRWFHRPCMLVAKPPALPAPRQSNQQDDAAFMGWQHLRSGEVLALYNVIAVGHSSYGSTVTDQGLLKLNLQIPWTPVPLKPVKKF